MGNEAGRVGEAYVVSGTVACRKEDRGPFISVLIRGVALIFIEFSCDFWYRTSNPAGVP